MCAFVCYIKNNVKTKQWKQHMQNNVTVQQAINALVTQYTLNSNNNLQQLVQEEFTQQTQALMRDNADCIAALLRYNTKRKSKFAFVQYLLESTNMDTYVCECLHENACYILNITTAQWEKYVAIQRKRITNAQQLKRVA